MAISSTLFLMVSTVLLALFHQSQKATNKAVESTDVTSTMLVVFEKIRSEMRGVRVLGVTDQRLQYWKVRSVDGIPQVTALGRPDYLPGEPAAPDSAYLYASNGLLVTDFQGKVHSLARLGKASQINFSWHASYHLLSISGYLATGAGKGDFLYRMYVANNE